MPNRAAKGGGGPGKGVGCLAWIAVLLFISLLFFLNRGKIETALKNTDFFGILRTRLASPAPSGTGRPSPSAQILIAPEASPRGSAAPRPAESPRASPAPRTSPSQGPSPSTSSKPRASAKPSSAPAPSQALTYRPAMLYFVRIDDDGTVIRQEVKRSIPSSDSPLTDALNALLSGPNAEELNKGLLSLIPQGTRLLSVKVRGSTATVNFSEEFMFNPMGIEGYVGQLKQVIWTATAFSTVQDVQIIIEGRKLDYLGGEGVFIGLPLSRNSSF